MNKTSLILVGTVIVLLGTAVSIFISLLPTCEEQIASYRAVQSSPTEAKWPKFAALSRCSDDVRAKY